MVQPVNEMRSAECGLRNILERDAAAAQFRLANRGADLTEALFEEALEARGIIAATGFGQGLINLLMDRLAVVIEKLQGLSRVCCLPGYVCRQGSTSVAGVLDCRLISL